MSRTSTEPLTPPFGLGPLLTLRASGYEASFAPAAGGRLASLDWLGPTGRRALVVPWDGRSFDSHAWPKAGAFPMIPFANRLAPEGFVFGGREVHLPPGPQGFALHGFVHRRAWQVIDAHEDTALFQLTHVPDAHWPWAFTAIQSVRLSGQGLALTLAVRNDSFETMPLSIGWHPYHPVGEDVAAQGLALRAAARHDLDSRGRAADEATAPAFNMAAGETAAFSGWDGRLLLPLGAEEGIAISCDGTDRLVLHAPAAGGYLCGEPVTQLPGRLGEGNTSGSDGLGAGAACAGATVSLTWRCAWQAAASACDRPGKEPSSRLVE